jgi:diguanylate cyclase (GGDEF)-like protein
LVPPDSVADAKTSDTARTGGRSSERAVDDEQTERLLHSAKRTQIIIAMAYLYDCAILFGYWAAGFVDIRAPIFAFLFLALLVGAVRWAHVSRWSLTRPDPTLFLPHQLCSIVVALGVAVVAPQIGFQPFATLFAISAFSFMAPNPKSLIVCWIAVAIGAAAVIFAVGPQLAMPTSTLAGQALTSAVVAGLLARCIWIAMFVRKLRNRLAEKNESLAKAMARIETLANVDEVTGLANRRAIAEALRDQMALSRRAGLPLTLAYIDIDHFKTINDAFGHLAGDRALKLLAERVLGGIRDCDRVGRFGGEEFLLIMNATTLRDASTPLERVRALVAASDWSEVDPSIHLTITIGAAQYTTGESIEGLIRRADLALYLGKETGRNRVVLNPPIDRPEPRRRALSA